MFFQRGSNAEKLPNLSVANYAADFMAIIQKRLPDIWAPSLYINLRQFMNQIKAAEPICFEVTVMRDSRRYFPEEWALCHELTRIIEKDFGILCDEQVDTLLLHQLLGAQYKCDVLSLPKIISGVAAIQQIAAAHLGQPVDGHSVKGHSFIQHTKFLCVRMYSGQHDLADISDWIQEARLKFAHAYQCAEEISRYTLEAFGHELTESEIVFLCVHLRSLGRGQ